MFCPNCGSQVAQGTRFCPMCGRTVNTVPVAPAAPVYQPTLQQTPSNGFADRVRETVRKVGGSPLFLIVTILYTLIQIISFLSIGYSDNSLFVKLFPVLREMGMSASDIRDISYLLNGGNAITTLIGMIPTILIMTGLWMIYGSSVSRNKRVSTAGYTMIQVITIIQLVFVGIALLLGFIGLLLGLASVSSYRYGTDDVLTTLAIVMAVYIAVSVFIFFYYIKICTTLSKVKNTLRTGTPDRTVSGFIAVICFIGGAINTISFLFGMMEMASTFVGITLRGLLYNLPTLFSAVILIFIGVLIFIYKSRMAELEYEESQSATPFYTQPQAQPVYRPVPQTLYQQSAPVAEPVVEEAPVVEEVPVVEEIPVIEETPIVEGAPVIEETPVIEEAPIIEEATIEICEETAPLEETPAE